MISVRFATVGTSLFRQIIGFIHLHRMSVANPVITQCILGVIDSSNLATAHNIIQTYKKLTKLTIHVVIQYIDTTLSELLASGDHMIQHMIQHVENLRMHGHRPIK